MLNSDNSLVIIIDIQEKLVNAVYDKKIAENASKLVQTAKILQIPTIITEQYPKGLGATIPEISDFCECQPIEKCAFSALEDIEEVLGAQNKKQVILCGIEAHICVYQTALALLEQGYEVYLMLDGIGSRKEFELQTAVSELRQLGAHITCLEMVLFEWLKSSRHKDFKAVQALIK